MILNLNKPGPAALTGTTRKLADNTLYVHSCVLDGQICIVGCQFGGNICGGFNLVLQMCVISNNRWSQCACIA